MVVLQIEWLLIIKAQRHLVFGAFHSTLVRICEVLMQAIKIFFVFLLLDVEELAAESVGWMWDGSFGQRTSSNLVFVSAR